MNTVQHMIVFTTVFFLLCAFVLLNPIMYRRTRDLAGISIESQESNNKKTKIFEMVSKKNELYDIQIENGCPEKAYRFGKGIQDSLKIIIG